MIIEKNNGKTEQKVRYMSIGANLKRLRQDKGITQKELSEKTELRTATISELENNEGNPTLSTIYKLMEVLECSADALLNDNARTGQNGVLKSMLERAEVLPEREKAIIIDIIDTYCITNGLNEFIGKSGWEKFDIAGKSDVSQKISQKLD